MSETQTLPPQAVLGELINGYWVSYSICAAARLGVADRLTDGPRTSTQLAKEVGADEASLFRLLRALASVGIFAETDPRTFAQTPLSEALRSGTPGSMRGLAVMTGLLHMRAWPEILHSVTTGKTGFEKVFGAELFEHLPKDPE